MGWLWDNFGTTLVQLLDDLGNFWDESRTTLGWLWDSSETALGRLWDKSEINMRYIKKNSPELLWMQTGRYEH